MAILTRQEIMNFNNKMLGLGAPIELDGQGYNKLDYGKMMDFSTKNISQLTDRQMWFITMTLGKYKNTQLTQYKGDIEDTINHYKALPISKPVVNVVDTSDKVIRLSWKFNQQISDDLKYSLNKKMYSWNKVNGSWVLNVIWEYVDELIKAFEAAGLDCSEVQKAVSNHIRGQLQPINGTPKVTSPKMKLKITRSTKSVDTLSIVSDYDAQLIDIYHTIPNMMWDAKTKSWVVYIENAAELYDAIPDDYDKKSLKPWADLVRGWETTHQLVNYSQLPLKFQPYDFQPQDAQKLLQLKIGLNANEVGCGKTFEQILIGESIPMKKLVICPATLRLNWEREIKMVNPGAVVHIQYSDQPFKTVEGWNIIGYPSLTKFQKQLEATLFQVVMADEAHFIQAVDSYGKPNSKRAESVLRIAATAQYVYPITGTPKTNRNLNLYNILRMLRHPLTRGKYAFSNYGKHFCDGQATRWGMDYSGNTNDKELNEILTPLMVRHLKKDVLPHLQKQRQAIPVSVNLREYFKAIDEYMEARKNREAEALVALTRAKQVVAVQKAQHTIELAKEISERGEKVVITTSFTEVVNQIEKAFQGCLKIVGGMSDKQKQATIDEFQNGSAQVIVLNYEAGGVGVTLTSSSTMLMNDLPWTTGSCEQAEGRIWRAGQTKTAMIYYIMAVGCPMDERLIDMIVYKSQTINRVMDNGLGDEMDLRKELERILTA